MKKLGKPEQGYSNARNLTYTEAQLLGLSQSVIIMNESGVTFWKSGRDGGLYSYITGSLAVRYDTLLTEFWNR